MRASTADTFAKYAFAVTCASVQTWTVLHTVCSRVSTCHRSRFDVSYDLHTFVITLAVRQDFTMELRLASNSKSPSSSWVTGL